MKQMIYKMAGVAGCFFAAFVSAASSAVDGNPYQIIVTRNPFGLQLPPIVQQTEAAPPDIVLTGISAVSDKKFALLKAEGKNFMFAEGQGDDKLQIELIAVDMNACKATVKNHGVVQVIVLARPLTGLSAVLEAAKERAAASRARREEQRTPGLSDSSSSNENGFPNHETVQAAVRVGTANNSGGNNSQNNSDLSGNNPANNTMPGSSSFGSDSGDSSSQAYQYWRKAAEEIEQARIATADRVRNGTWQPYPLTPLTPANTPAELIGSDSVFMEHGPGVVLSNGSP